MIVTPTDAPAWAQRLATDLNREFAELRQMIEALKQSDTTTQADIDALDARVTALEP
jgi:hypothetical protein